VEIFFHIIYNLYMGRCEDLINKLYSDGILGKEEFVFLLENRREAAAGAASSARKISEEYFGRGVYLRGLVEISSFCKNDCKYCGLRRDNVLAERYRLTKEEILECCAKGHGLGYRTFVFQGGEDSYFTDDRLTDIIRSVKSRYPDCAVTVSMGERGAVSFRKIKEAGADRYLLRHETADPAHYGLLHTPDMSYGHRMACLKSLKELGFQTGCGFMVGSPYQTMENIADDLIFIGKFKPEMCGIGPFIPHKDTPFGNEKAGSAELTVFILSLVRIMLKNVLLPATTALGTVEENGREMGILAGANVVMPNLSPVAVRRKYMLYNNKLVSGAEDAAHKKDLEARLLAVGYHTVSGRGDWSNKKRQ